MHKDHGFLAPFLAIVATAMFLGGLYIHGGKGAHDDSDTLTQTLNSDYTYAASGTALSLTKDGTAVQTLSLNPDTASTVKNVPEDKIFITNQDVNFDGYADAAVLSSVTDGTVYTYDYYLFNPTTEHLEKSAVLTGISNPTLDIGKKAIESSYESGTSWYTQEFQFTGKTYTKENAVMVTDNE